MSTTKRVNILIPTYKRLKALAVTLTSLYYQSEKNFDIIISDQSSDDGIENDNSIQTIKRLLELQQNNVIVYKNLPRRGMAQQRQFLLDHSNAQYSLFLDDDLLLEPFVLRNMAQVLENERCGFVGCAVIGLSYKDDHRPHQQHIEFWKDHVVPEKIIPQSDEWQRYKLHSAANLFHVEQKYRASANEPLRYKVAWVGGCVMYDTEKLRDVGGFNFWKDLPQDHCGEDVLAQLRMMKIYGGCGIIPSGVYHQELETTVPDRTVNAPEYLDI
jgi:glycosyltransferase involved in cell wall biosynthesis